MEMDINAAQCKFFEFRKKMMNFKIVFSTRVKIMSSLMHSRLIYSCQARILTKRQADHDKDRYVSMLRQMVKGSYRQKPVIFLYEMSNEGILQRCNTEKIPQFIARQQHNFTAHLIRGENTRMTIRLPFNDDSRKKLDAL